MFYIGTDLLPDVLCSVWRFSSSLVLSFASVPSPHGETELPSICTLSALQFLNKHNWHTKRTSVTWSFQLRLHSHRQGGKGQVQPDQFWYTKCAVSKMVIWCRGVLITVRNQFPGRITTFKGTLDLGTYPMPYCKDFYPAAEVSKTVIIKLKQTQKSLNYAWELSSPTRIKQAQNPFQDTSILPCLWKVQHSTSSNIDFEDMIYLTK